MQSSSKDVSLFKGGIEECPISELFITDLGEVSSELFIRDLGEVSSGLFMVDLETVSPGLPMVVLEEVSQWLLLAAGTFIPFAKSVSNFFFTINGIYIEESCKLMKSWS